MKKERETFLCEVTMSKERIVAPSASLGRLPADEQLRHLHSALQQCLGLLEDVIRREKEEFGTDGSSEYGRMQNTVKDRLGHLLGSTKLLLVAGDATATLTPAPEKGSSFGLKLWTYRVLQELIHWTLSASQTLHSLQSQREKEAPKAARRGRRGKGRMRK
ncbi:hypothetical protein Z043_121399 [Scleropages formosus]|uniref:Uncharacterized protein n=1 Tax=Scleropages formosus TaxID=113540 RepID=A0A0P7WC32_SCLFO|nr:hypothetical protein Z043_121399 [Scleropages formosus]